MTRSIALTIVACLATLACDPDPASKVRIIERPEGTPGFPTSASTAPVIPPFRSELCAVEPEQVKGSTRFALNGPCSFQHTGDVKCRAALDDFHIAFLRKGPGDATVALYLNVEFYKGPGNYEGGQMFLTAQTGSAYYHWGSDSVKTTVGPALRYVVIPETRLVAEPPNTGTVTVSGRFGCADLSDEKKAK